MGGQPAYADAWQAHALAAPTQCDAPLWVGIHRAGQPVGGVKLQAPVCSTQASRRGSGVKSVPAAVKPAAAAAAAVLSPTPAPGLHHTHLQQQDRGSNDKWH